MKVEIGEFYTDSPYRSNPDDPTRGATMIADVNEADSYEVDEASVFAIDDGTFILRTASGCSCWDGEYYGTRYDSLDELFTDIGPKGQSDYSYNPTFAGAEELRRQATEAGYV
jgi:hypothetical protein